MKKIGLIFSMCLFTVLGANAQQITNAEYFFDTDPGVGNGTPITISTPGDTVLQGFTFPTAVLSIGYHRIWVRTQDSLGQWSLYMDHLFHVNRSEERRVGKECRSRGSPYH